MRKKLQKENQNLKSRLFEDYTKYAEPNHFFANLRQYLEYRFQVLEFVINSIKEKRKKSNS